VAGEATGPAGAGGAKILALGGASFSELRTSSWGVTLPAFFSFWVTSKTFGANRGTAALRKSAVMGGPLNRPVVSGSASSTTITIAWTSSEPIPARNTRDKPRREVIGSCHSGNNASAPGSERAS
jgi:hypothetical protein